MNRWRMVVVCVAALVCVGVTASGFASAAPDRVGGSSAGHVNLTFWFWGDFDAPGANKALAQDIKAYEAANPNISIKVIQQATDSLIANFQAAAAAKSGPDIASLWATGPVLGAVWQDAVAPISDYVPAKEIKHWRNTPENVYHGKLWAMPVYLIGIPLAYNKILMRKAGLDPNRPLTTWNDLIAACGKLRQAGITPFEYGASVAINWPTQLMLQNLDSLSQLKSAVVGKSKFTDARYAASDQAWAQAVTAKCFNDDVSSISIDQAVSNFSAGKAAMALGTDGMVQQWQKDLGRGNVAVSKWPVFGHGKMKNVFDATQSTSYFITAWSKHKREAADFLTFLHSKAALATWYKATHVPPADDRFNAKQITDPLSVQLYHLDTTGPQVWLPNFVPAQVDEQGDGPAMQALFSGRPASEASQLRERAASLWRREHKSDLKNWQGWQPVSPQ